MTDQIDDLPFDGDLAERFARLDRIEPPENWGRASALAETTDPGPAGSSRWWAAAAAAVLVVGGVVAVASTRGGGDAPFQETSRSAPASDAVATPSAPAPPSTVSGAGPSPYGSARVEPASVVPGGTVTVTPNGVVDGTCSGFGAIFRVDGPSPVRLGVLGPDGSFVPENQRPTIPPCQPPATAEALSFLISDDVATGVVSICRSVEFSDAACGQLIVVDAGATPGASIEMPVVEGLTEFDAIVTLRALDLTVSVERREVDARSNVDGRVVSQAPVAATSVAAGETVTIIVGQAVGRVVDDELAQTLVDSGADVGAAPTEASALDGATFCGSERTGVEGFLSVDIDIEGRRCLLDHHAARLPAVFVSEFLTGPVSRIVVVTRTREDGTAVGLVHTTSDADDPGRWDVDECGPLTDFSNASTPAVAFACDGNVDPLTGPITIDALPFPAWFERRTTAPTCGYFTPQVEVRFDREVDQPLVCMADAIAGGEPAELVTVHVGDELRVARWIVSIGPSPQGTPQFEVASLVVDLRAGTTRWVEPRCVEGELVDGRLVGDFVVGRDQVDELDPSGTVVTEDGEVLTLPEPDERNQVQPCNGPQKVERPAVTPFEATGLRVGDIGPEAARFPGSNEVGEFDLTIERSWTPVATSDSPEVVGFIRETGLTALPPPDDARFPDPPVVIYADDGVTRVGEFGPEGAAVLD